MRLSDIKGEAALDVLADIIEPAGEIMMDEEMRELVRGGANLKAVKVAIKNHKKAVLEILARLDGENPETYEVNVFTLPTKLLDILNDPEFVNLFTSQGQNEDNPPSGSATENIEDENQ